jgi:hypothetical protein
MMTGVTIAASRLPAMTHGVVKRAAVPASICDDLKPLKKTVIATAQYAETAVLTALGKAAWAGFLKTAGSSPDWRSMPHTS